ncbi:hypothetical protein F441_13981 [Phytophthora nicotianae CJ01A1]|uniref:Uncharacterized protein n=4 Tax=Phytophthora nicotianae TaxID=4792 RepID=V9EMW9_PHYNI|nr:hypothetical protein F443_14055 [Phytophthora nicotianae P1569]ETK80672.1 hypothetical protein L915_13698 [Phytophthora nicotianae]ETO69279.1 hypothetical protein F444_14086 [Phytophthora nicotianae P1976]ETP10329.1 hypothetical protein F441_13981 [Phytophthora nicotianae CJ01A1]ETL34094.1 hypothetical protein L916_13597 [Phytophthora nicotianae]
MASTGDESHRESNKRVQGESHEVEANAGKAAAPGGPARAPSSSAVTADANWQRKRSAVLLNVMHPENTRETAAFVDRLPRSAALRVLFALFAYALLVSDVPRAGSSVDSLPFVQIEPNVFTVYGPTALPGHTIFRNGSIITDGESLISSEIPTALYKFTPSSYGLRTARDLLETSPKLNSSWPACILSAHSTDSAYSSDCGDSLPGTTVFSMLDTLAEALAANAPSTTSYKNVAQTDDGIAIMARGELSSLPQRVCFAARAKARWTGTSSASSGSTAASSSTSFLSRNLLDHKYWLSVWVTTFADLDPANPGVDLCVDDLDRPLFCEKPWAASLTVDGSERDALWETVSLRTAALQQNLSKNEKLDITLIEAESDPLTRLGGAVLLAHKIYNVVVLYRIRDCTNPDVCTTTTIFDERVEGKILYTDALEWSSLASTLRYIGQLYVIVRVVCLFVACYAVGSVFDTAASADTSRLKRTLRVFFAVPSQVVVYGSWLPVLCYASAHIIDALILYELEDDGGESTTDSFAALTRWLAVHMRCVWLMALLARFRALLQTSAGAWTPSHGVSGVRGHLLPTLALGAVAFVAQGGIAVDDRDARILEANEVEPVPTFMLLRSETLDAWKMNLEGVYSDMLAVALAAIIYVVVILAVRALMRWHRRRWVKPTNFSQVKPQEKGDAVPDPLFFARSAVPSAAGALWEPSCLSVSWDDDLLGPLLTMLNVTPWISQRNLDKKQGTSQDNTDNNVANDEIGTSSASTAQRMLMNLVFLSDPWNLLVLKLGRARVHLYHLRGNGLNCKVVHANAKARVAREYSLALENVELVASLRASELSWSQLVTCK